MEDVTKLPKWAQAKIGRLERQVEALGLELKGRDAEVPTPVYYETGWPRAKHFLPKEPICFKIPSDKMPHRDYSLEVHIEESTGTLVVRGYDTLRIMPHSSNMIKIDLER